MARKDRSADPAEIQLAIEAAVQDFVAAKLDRLTIPIKLTIPPDTEAANILEGDRLHPRGPVGAIGI